MSALIKHGHDMAPLAWRTNAASTKSEPNEDPKVTALEQEVNHLRRQLDESGKERVKAIEDARAQAKKEADAAHKRADADALAALKEGIATALAEMKTHVLQEQALALLLTRVALERVFADASDFQGLIERAIRLQLATLRRESVLRVCVSSNDFSDEIALAAISEAIGNGVNVVQDATLASGDCQIDLRLGQVELSISKHWQALQDELHRLVAASEAT